MTDIDAPADHATALEILRWAAARAGKVGFATGFGAEGCVIIDLIARHDLPIKIFTLDTGVLFPETYELWERLEAKYGIDIEGVQAMQTIEEQAIAYGSNLWERDPDRCCEMRKVEPLRYALRGYDSWITAIRRDQTVARANAQIVEHDALHGLRKINPLVAWTHDDVWGHLYANDVPYNALHAQGYPSIGCAPCTSPIIPGESLRSGRWRGKQKTECGLHYRKAAESS